MESPRIINELKQKIVEEQRLGRILQARLDSMQRQLDKVQNSYSWKITEPLRALARALFRFRSRHLRHEQKTILMIDQYVPEPDRDAGSRNMLNYIRVLGQAGYVIKFWPQVINDPAYAPRLQQWGAEVIHSDDYSPHGLLDWVGRHAHEVDVVFISRPDVANRYLHTVKTGLPQAHIVYYGHDIHHLRIGMQAALTQDPIIAAEAGRLEGVERHIWNSVDYVVYPSSEEAEVVRRMAPRTPAAHVFPFAFDQLGRLDKAPEKRRGILFVSNYGHTPNGDAALWLVCEIMPIVWRHCPDEKLYLVGAYPTPEILALGSAKVIVTGAVSEAALQDYYNTMRICAVPLRFGAGIKLKVVEAINYGLPLVTTSVGVQGMDALRRIVAIEDSAEGFAAALVELLKSDPLWQEKAAAQLAYARENFSFDTIRDHLLPALEKPAAKSRLRSSTYGPAGRLSFSQDVK
jgi:glycosyltransferase involved in cell wall biosynthesis